MGAASIRLQGAPNFRDFGGVPAGGAFVVASGRLFRSDLLKDATNADLEILQHLGIKGVCDLRSAKERVRHANRWPEGSPVTAIGPVPEPGLEAVQAGNLRDRIIADEFDPAEAREALAAGYRQMPVSLGPSLRAVFEYLLETEAAPVLIHCTSGKDRSGFMAAMVLTALGAQRDAILVDYLLSRERTPKEPIRQMLRRTLGEALPEARLDMLLELTTVRAEYLDAAFAEIEQNHGGIELYLRDIAGLGPEELLFLRTQLLIDRRASQDIRDAP
jgi:protein-tyrosine phosphatase